MNRQLAQAVITTFRDPDPVTNRKRLAHFGLRDWRHTLYWLDASGLALYFLVRLRSLFLQDAIPESVLSQLDERLADNKVSTTLMFREFVRLNVAFQEAGLTYLNLKGFTLVPDYCPAPALRYQMDCDFLLAETFRARCTDLLRGLGYTLTFADHRVMEFKAGMNRLPHIRDLYKPKPQRLVEIHLCGPCRPAGLGLDGHAMERRRVATLDGFSFPAPAAADMFVAQAFHLLRHLQSEWTRVSWLLEFRNLVLKKQHDNPFWHEVEELASRTPDASLAIAVAIRLAAEGFGDFAPDALRSLVCNRVPDVVALWIKRYAASILLSDHPGTKLYLLLQGELNKNKQKPFTVRKRLLPLRPPAQVIVAARGGPRQQLLGAAYQFRYVLFRLRFHVKEGARYLVEAWRWKRLLARQSRPLPTSKKSTPAESCSATVEG